MSLPADPAAGLEECQAAQCPVAQVERLEAVQCLAAQVVHPEEQAQAADLQQP